MEILYDNPEKLGEDGTPVMIIRVPIVKASTKEDPSFAEVCIDDLPEDVVKAIYIAGCKVYLNQGASKITGTKTDKSRQAAMEIAAERLEMLYSGKIRMPSGVRTKISGAVKTEAMRMARLIIKDGLKAIGEKVSHYSAKDITALATELINGEQGKEILADAQAAIEERSKKEQQYKKANVIDLSKIKPDKGLVAKASARAAASRKPKAEGARAH